jgi:hypothetical protein
MFDHLGDVTDDAEDTVDALDVDSDAVSPECETSCVKFGNCWLYSDGVCGPRTDADCADKQKCFGGGGCSAVPYNGHMSCFPDSDAECAQADVCTKVHPELGGKPRCKVWGHTCMDQEFVDEQCAKQCMDCVPIDGECMPKPEF